MNDLKRWEYNLKADEMEYSKSTTNRKYITLEYRIFTEKGVELLIEVTFTPEGNYKNLTSEVI